MIRKMGSFRSYVGLEEYEMKPTSVKGDESIQPDYLNGELVIFEALNVLKFTSSSKKKGLSGSLFVTNGRVIFVTSEKTLVTKKDAISLLSINTLWYYENPKGSDGGKKHRRAVKLGPSSLNNPNLIPSGSTRVHELLIVCSNFRTSRFSFKFSPIDHGLRICNAIIHHAFPNQLERLFYFDFSKVTSADWRKNMSKSTMNVPTYLEKGDWFTELNITRSIGYRISNINEAFQLCGSLPEWIVVPSDLNDVRVTSLAEKLKGGRPPHWSWGNSRGAAILKMSKLNNEADSSAENAFFELLRKNHVKKMPPEIVDVDKVIPSKELRTSFNKLVELSCPESNHHYEENDQRFYSLLDQTKWLNWISKTLEIVNYASERIVAYQAVVILQEQESRDISCLCSSVLQVVTDARFRTVQGFFSLIQKEWIAFGHPFHSSYMHASPVLLLFLDTVHQLMLQNPTEFEFNDKLLCHVWDSSFDSTRGTFLFDTPQQRKEMDRSNEYTAWSTVLSPDEEVDPSASRLSVPGAIHAKLASPSRGFELPRSLTNPFHSLKSILTPSSADKSQSVTLHCSSCMGDLELWDTLYLNRTLETTPKVGMQFDDRVSKSFFMADRYSSSSTPTPTSKSPDTVESTFVYPPRRLESTSSIPLPESLDKMTRGRDNVRELKVVESLLEVLATTTKYTRSMNAGYRSGHSKSVSGGSSSSSHSSSPSVVSKVGGRFRKNPFS